MLSSFQYAQATTNGDSKVFPKIKTLSNIFGDFPPTLRLQVSY